MSKEVTKTIIKEVTKIPRPTKKVRKPKIIKQSLDKTIVENLIELQKVHVDLAQKFDKLSNQLGDLLVLFEMAAKSFASSPGVQASEKDKEFLEKVDKLLEQNKTIAKGLMLMEERARERIHSSPEPSNVILEKDHNEAPIREGDKLTPSLSDPDRPLPRF